MTRIWLRENKLQGLYRRERMRVYKTVTISKLLFKKKKSILLNPITQQNLNRAYYNHHNGNLFMQFDKTNLYNYKQQLNIIIFFSQI